MRFDPAEKDKFINLLNDEYEFPVQYFFKFIVPSDKVNIVNNLIGDAEFSHRPSRNGKYTSVSAKKMVASAEEVVEIYERLSVVEGIVSL